MKNEVFSISNKLYNNILNKISNISSTKNELETYNLSKSDWDEDMILLSARQIGSDHIQKNIPCQDYCLVEEYRNSTILTVSDGVSASKFSDEGSRLICEITIKEIKKVIDSVSSQEELRDIITSQTFLKELIESWIREVINTIRNKNNTNSNNIFSQVTEYAATILFAVITKDWYIIGNLGDGQIILFNDLEHIKLRIHKPKETRVVDSLIDGKAYLEEFTVGAFPKSDFNSILLSTDGMYEVLEKGNLFYNFGKQLNRRLKQEKIKPFGYFEEGKEEITEICQNLSKDDCTIILATNKNNHMGRHEEERQIIAEFSKRLKFDREGEELTIYRILTDKNKTESVVVSNDKDKIEINAKSIKSAELIDPISEVSRNGRLFTIYPKFNLPSLEFLYSNGDLKEKAETESSNNNLILRLFKKLKNLEKELGKNNLQFNNNADLLIFYDEDTNKIYFTKEALEIKNNKETKFWNYFNSLLGILKCGPNEKPLFKTGLVALGEEFNRLDVENELMGVVETQQNKPYIKNLGKDIWVVNEVDIYPNQSVELSDKLILGIPFQNTKGEFRTIYRFIPKEAI